MKNQQFYKNFGNNAPENYERYFVPAIGEPVARDLIQFAALQPGERVLDVGCGTGIVTRLASEQVGTAGTVTGIDINPGMLAVARSVTSAGSQIKWHEASAEKIPLPDNTYDVVLCQLSLQFMEDKIAALKEMRRVLIPGGRLALNVPGPAGDVFTTFAEAVERHINREAAQFANHVFSLHDTDEIRDLLNSAGFSGLKIQAYNKKLSLPAPKDFLWQYIHSTPLVGLISKADNDTLTALEKDIVGSWEEFTDENDTMRYQQRLVTASGKN